MRSWVDREEFLRANAAGIGLVIDSPATSMLRVGEGASLRLGGPSERGQGLVVSSLRGGTVFSSVALQGRREATVTQRPTKTELAKAYGRLCSVPAVADQLGVAFETARRWLLDAGVELNRKGRPSSAANNMPMAEVKRRYLKGESIAQLGIAFGVSPATVRSRLIDAGVELRPRPGWKY